MPQKIEVPGVGMVEFPDGMSDEQIAAAIKQNLPRQVGLAEDVAKSAGAGLASGVFSTLGMPGDVRNMAAGGLQWLAEKAGYPQLPQQVVSFLRTSGAPLAAAVTTPLPTSQDVRGAVEQFTGPLRYEPQTTAGKFAYTLGEFAPGALLGPGRLGQKAVTQWIAPALASETAGQLTAGTPNETAARIVGALAGATAPAALRRMITPLPTDTTRQKMIEVMARENVPLTAGQKTGSKALQYVESTLGDAPFAGGQASRMQAQQVEALTRAALRRTGEEASRATPDVIDQAFRRIGETFDRIGGRNAIRGDANLGDDLLRVASDYVATTPTPNNAITREISAIADRFAQGGGTLPGNIYQEFRSRFERYARAAKNDPQLASAWRGIKDALDDAMERSLTATGNTADIAAWNEARNQYRNLLAISRAATAAGAEAAEGLITPRALRTALVGQSQRNYARGLGDLAELSHAANALMQPLPQSGTPPRLAAHMLGGLFGTLLGGPEISTAAAAAMGGPALAGRVVFSPPAQAWLGNQALANFAPRAGQSLLLQALMAEPRRQQRLTYQPQ